MKLGVIKSKVVESRSRIVLSTILLKYSSGRSMPSGEYRSEGMSDDVDVEFTALCING